MTKFVQSRVVETKRPQPAKPSAYAMVFRPGKKPHAIQHYVTSRYQGNTDPSALNGNQLNLLA